jgi:hypothetical protein
MARCHSPTGSWEQITAIVDDVEEFPGISAAKRRKAEVIENEELGLGKPGKERPVAAVQATQRDVLQQTAETDVAHAHPRSATSLTKRAGEIGLPHPGRTDDDHVLVTRHEVSGKERPPRRPVKASGGGEVDVLRTGGETQPRLPKEPGKHGVAPVGPLGVDQKAETFFKGKTGDVGVFHLGGKRIGHAAKPEFPQAFKGGLT